VVKDKAQVEAPPLLGKPFYGMAGSLSI